MQAKALILDIDGTISPEVSWLALTRDMGGSVATHSDIFERYRRGLMPYNDAKRQLVALWHETGCATRPQMSAMFEAWPLRPEASVLVRAAYGLEMGVCLITGSLDLYAQIVARRLDIIEYYANTELVFNKGGELTDFHYDLMQGPKKLRQLHDYCVRHGVSEQECVVVGDGESELEMFQSTKRGILLRNPEQSQALREAAWKIIDSLGEVESLLIA
jgi:HAD superfamily phosphoserine phosphatase-like hydrolase